MKLKILNEECQFEAQRDLLMGDQLLFGIGDVMLCDKLMRKLDRSVTLEYVVKAIQMQETAVNLKM